MKKLTKWLASKESLVLLVMLAVLLRIPSLFEPAWYGDENIYLAIGQGMRKGLILYKDITDFPNKPPLIYLLAAGAQTVFWFRLLLLVWNSVNVVVFFKLVEAVFKKSRQLWYWLTLGFILMTSLPVWEGNIANAEIFMILPTTAAFLLLWQRKLFWSGVMLGVAFLFKIPVATDIAAAGLVFGATYWLGAGLLVPLVVAVIWHGLQGVTPTALLGNAVGSTGYVSVWQNQEGILAWLTLSTLPSRFLVTAILVGVILALKKRLSRAMILASLWVVLAMFGATLSARPYPHYLIQMVPGLVLLVAAVVVSRKSRVNLAVGVGVILLGLGMYLRFGFGAYPVASYYGNFVRYISGNISRFEYFNSLDLRMKRNYQVAEYIKMRTEENDKIFIWGTNPGIYFLSERLGVGRLVTSFHVEDINEYERLGKELAAAKPPYIVVMRDEPLEFKQLNDLLEAKYVVVKEIEEAQIYRLMEEVL